MRQVARGEYAFIAPNEAADYQLSKMAPEIACRVQKLEVEYAPGGIALGLQNNSPYKELFDQRWAPALSACAGKASLASQRCEDGEATDALRGC